MRDSFKAFSQIEVRLVLSEENVFVMVSLLEYHGRFDSRMEL